MSMDTVQWTIWGELLVAVVVFFTIVVMQWANKLPTVASVEKLASILNSRGGNIMVLGSLSLLFFFTAVRFGYWVIGKQTDGKIPVNDALVMTLYSWMTGMAFGGAFGALIKTMTGEDSHVTPPPGSDSGASVTVSAVPVVTPSAELVAETPKEEAPKKPDVGSGQKITGDYVKNP